MLSNVKILFIQAKILKKVLTQGTFFLDIILLAVKSWNLSYISLFESCEVVFCFIKLWYQTDEKKTLIKHSLEMVFASEANSTFATIIDDFFTAKQGSFVESTPVGKQI